MQTRSLKTLARISQVRSFAQAAQQLNMTLSAVSMQMKSLEHELSISLFDRSFRPPKLTPLGQAVAKHATKLLAVEEDLLNTCSSSEQLLGHFTLGFVATTSARLLPGFIKAAAAHAPRAQFEFETGLSEILAKKVVNGQLDAAIITASGPPSRRLNYHVLTKEPFVFASHFSKQNVPIETLIKTTPFLHFMPNTGIGKLIASHMEKFSSSHNNPVPSIVLDSVEAIVECVKQDIGFTLLPEPDIKRYADDSVVIFDFSAFTLERQLVLITAQNGHMEHQVPALKYLLDPDHWNTPESEFQWPNKAIKVD